MPTPLQSLCDINYLLTDALEYSRAGKSDAKWSKKLEAVAENVIRLFVVAIVFIIISNFIV